MITAMALCPNHPQQTAVLTCARCGTFACEACTSPADGKLCVNCGGRVAPSLLDVGQFLQSSFGLLLRNPTAVVLLGVSQIAFGLVTLPLSLAMDVSRNPESANPLDFLGTVIPAMLGLLLASTVYSAVAHAVFIRFIGNVLEGGNRTPGELVREGFGRVLPLLGLNLVLGITLGIGFMLCLVPGVFLSTALMLATPAVVLHPAGPIEALSISWDRSDGHRWGLLLLLVVCFGSMFAVGMVGGVGALLLRPLGMTGEVVGTILSQGVSSLGTAIYLTIVVLSYLRLSGRWLPGAESR
jgi:hypothetical protein